MQALLLNGFVVGLEVIIGVVAINMIIGNVLEPRLMGKKIGAFHAGGIPVFVVLGMVARNSRNVALCAAHHGIQNCLRSQPQQP